MCPLAACGKSEGAPVVCGVLQAPHKIVEIAIYFDGDPKRVFLSLTNYVSPKPKPIIPRQFLMNAGTKSKFLNYSRRSHRRK